jgi:hypothetical protein
MLDKYISSSSKRAEKIINRFSILNGKISVYIKDPLPKNVNFKNVISKVRKFVPDTAFHGIESIIIGQFDDFAEKHVNALYADNKLYITNEQDNEDDLVDDIIHEISHSLETHFDHELYSDGLIKAEFLGKRNKLLDILTSHGYNVPDAPSFASVEYSPSFDDFLYKEIGYSKIANHVRGLFVGPYSATSLHEYFATGFEEYFMNLGQRQYLKILCPILYKKLEMLETRLESV